MFSNMLMSNKPAAPSGGGWTPASLPNLVGWWRAQDEPLGAMASWTDLSGNGNHLLQATGAKQPVNTASQIGGQNAALFDGADDALTVGMSLPVPYQVIVIMKPIAWSDFRYLYCMGTDFHDGALWYRSPATTVSVGGSIGGASIAPRSAILGVPFVYAVTFSKTFVNQPVPGRISINNNVTYIGDITNITSTAFSVGSNLAGSANANIAVAEIIVLSTEAPAADETSIYTYFNNLYGFSL